MIRGDDEYEDQGCAKQITVELIEYSDGSLRVPTIAGTRIEAKLGSSLDINTNQSCKEVAIEANKEGLIWLAHQLLARAFHPSADPEVRLHVHLTDYDYAVKHNGVAVTVYRNDGLKL